MALTVCCQGQIDPVVRRDGGGIAGAAATGVLIAIGPHVKRGLVVDPVTRVFARGESDGFRFRNNDSPSMEQLVNTKSRL